MINAQLYAVDVGDKYGLFEPGNLTPSSFYGISKVLNNEPIFNYAAFFGQGINLYDNTLCIGDESDYYGYIGNLQSVEIFGFNGDIISISNGITVIFDRYSCKKIEVYVQETLEEEYTLVSSVENNNGLPKETYIDVSGEVFGKAIKLVFSGYPENAYVTLKGLILGKIIEIKNFFSYNSIAEIRPLGDDLPMNELNFESLITEEFFGEENQTLKIYDNLVLYENNFLVSSKESTKNKYNIKARNEINLMDKDTADAYYWQGIRLGDWNNAEIYAEDVLYYAFENNIECPDWFTTYRISPFVKTQSKRKMLQQLAWATCCAVDTTYGDKIKLVPYLATETTIPDIVINNADGRTKSLELIKGEKYSVVKCKIPSYTKKTEIEVLGKATQFLASDLENRYSFNLNEPFNAYDIGNSIVNLENPYFIEFENESGGEQTVTGYKYEKVDKTLEIAISSYGSVLEISNQEVYPLDMTEKEKQIKKWYSNNNTIKATLVDNEDLKVGKVLKIQLENGKYFQGIIIKIERSNIADKHLIDLEAHEWN